MSGETQPTVAEALRKLGWRMRTVSGEDHWEHPNMPEIAWSPGIAAVQGLRDAVQRILALEELVDGIERGHCQHVNGKGMICDCCLAVLQRIREFRQ